MRIVLAAAEIAPWAKVGGLADVVGSLPKALAKLGHEVVVAIPAYGFLTQELRPYIFETKTGVDTQINGHLRVQSVVHRAEWKGFEIWLIDGEERFKRIERSENLYAGSRDDYIFFSHALLRACEALDWIPDILHVHDWQMGLLPALVREAKGQSWEETATCFTIHNFAHQGEFGVDTLDAAGLSRELFTYDRLETYGGVNFLKSACTYADMVNTVSPTYATEITTNEHGGRLSGLMHYLRGKGHLKGILNGIDTAVHDPETDKDLPAHFSADHLAGKAVCREALAKQLKLKIGKDTLVCGMISRLSEQKGFDLLIQSAPAMIRSGAVIIVQALGSPVLADRLAAISHEFPRKFIHVQAFDPPLAQRIYGGCDAFLMPSHFEPCGLGQMFAMRYGTVPIVRFTGGLADTVIEGVTGFVFGAQDPEEFYRAVRRAIEAHRNPAEWAGIVRSGMIADWSWDHSAPEYVAMYEQACSLRSMVAA